MKQETNTEVGPYLNALLQMQRRIELPLTPRLFMDILCKTVLDPTSEDFQFREAGVSRLPGGGGPPPELEEITCG